MTTKRELYESIVDIQKKHGQGLAGFVGKMNSQIQFLLDELVKEGYIVESICHFKTLPDDNWYVPAQGYNVWKDDEPNALTFVRLFLGQTEEIFLNFPFTYFVQNVDFMKSYAIWLEKNHESLTIMLNLDPVYKGDDSLFTQEEIDFIKSKDWYKDNKKVSECVALNNEGIDISERILELSNKMKGLMNNKPDPDNDARIESEKKEIKLRRRLNSHLLDLKKDKKIQEELELG